jgi:tetratricopeptide (TPR) repeat protein
MKLIFTFLIFVAATTCAAQVDTTVTKLKKAVQDAKNTSDKLDAYAKLASEYYLKDDKACQETIDQMIYEAEQSRNREMMVKSRRLAASVFGQSQVSKEGRAKTLQYAKQALEIAKTETGLEKERLLSLMAIARHLRNENNFTEARKYNDNADQIAATLPDDSLKVIAKLGLGRTLLMAGEKIDAFRIFLTARELAEKSKHPNKDFLEISVVNSLSAFYSSIEDYDKAIDNQYLYYDYARKNKNHYDALSTLSAIGGLFINAKKNDAAKKTYEELIRLSDSLKIKDYKISGLAGLLNVMMASNDGKASLAFLNAHPEIAEVFKTYNVGYMLDFGMAQVFMTAKMYDSATSYFNKSLPLMIANSAKPQLANVYLQYGKQLYESGQYKAAIESLLKCKRINDSLGNSNENLNCYDMLDSSFQKTGDYKNAWLHKDLYQQTKKIIDEKSKAKDILSLELDAETKRSQRKKAEEEEARIRRHNLQYMGIVIGIISLFIALVMLGLFKVPIKFIRVMGFISFIFLFEFIIFLADTWIHHATHGEPLKVLGIKVVLIALLLPLHHFLEHKVIHYLTHKFHADRLAQEGQSKTA